MTVYLFNMHGRKHRDLFERPSDSPLEPFFDLEIRGPQARMVPQIENGTECIVASYAPGRTHVIFATYTFARFDKRPTREEPDGRPYRAFLGTPNGKPTEPMPKGKAAATPRYKEFFNKLGNFKGRSAFQR